MADDLDWRAIIAPGDDAERDETAGAARGGRAHDKHPHRPPMTRREARAAREAAAAAEVRPDARAASPATTDAARAAAAAQAARTADLAEQHDIHPDVHSLLGPASPAAVDDASNGHAEAPTAAGTSAAASRPAAADGSVAAGIGPGGGNGGSGSNGGSGGNGRGPKKRREPRRKRSKVALTVGIILVLLVAGGGFAGYAFIVPKIQSVAKTFSGKSDAPQDYTGSGAGKVTVTINDGDLGSTVAATLHRDGVTASYDSFYQLLLASPSIQFQPGSYTLKRKMSAKSALSALQDPTNKVQNAIVVPEGEVLADIEATLVKKTGLSAADVSAAAKNVSAYGLPSGVTSLEGWLFPATYPVTKGWTAEQYFKTMVSTMMTHLDDAGVPVAQRQHIVIFASLVQKEAGVESDFPKVARVFQNRIDQGMDLQSDATVAYGTGHTDRVTTTDAERNDASNPYNTYKHAGLPPGPISNPGDVAIDAALHPASGSWLYFVTVNLQTGETVYSDTYAEHEQAVAQFQAWLRAHPSYQ